MTMGPGCPTAGRPWAWRADMAGIAFGGTTRSRACMEMSFWVCFFGAIQVDKKTTTTGSGPEQLAELLGEAMDVEGEDKATIDQKKADFLRLRLDAALPPAPSDADRLSIVWTQVHKKLFPLEGRAIGDVLLDEQAPLEVVQAIKDYGKKLSDCRDRQVEHNVGIAIYYAAIGSALVYRDQRITSWSYAILAEAFDMLRNKRWMDPKLSRLYSRARKICKKKMK